MKARKLLLKTKTFDELGILPGVIKVLQSKEIHKPTDIQLMAMPWLLKNISHSLVSAQTGTGKTLTYTLPLFQILRSQYPIPNPPPEKHSPRAIIIVPNRDLSRQCEGVLNQFQHETGLKTFSSFTGQKLNIECSELEKGVDILIATPERIDNHIKNKTLNFSKLTNMIIDESDTLIDAGLTRHLDSYYQELHKTVKFSFVSATFPLPLQNFILERFSYNENDEKPYIKKIIDEKAHLNLTNLKHEFVELKEHDKKPVFEKVLDDVCKDIGDGGCMIFCNNIPIAYNVEKMLIDKGLKAVSLHGDVNPKRRTANIQAFVNKEAKFMVCTDLASRGLDFPFVSYVLQYDFPITEGDYVHRAGRTGRAGRPGTVITLYRKENIPTVLQFKRSFEKNEPLRMQSSAFSMKNKLHHITSKQTSQEKLKNILHKIKE
ncbi:hypothetical protein SteCoe_17499 [Stentor coeruleus]|uniref:RNA helicase n=1 Tax=Stentor coeruleus TaxID=5963 RepID=A0A1R2BYT4_9CILI|nr:hypothetical protein SteCoe_17499 [Stentor coeruleus]